MSMLVTYKVDKNSFKSKTLISACVRYKKLFNIKFDYENKQVLYHEHTTYIT